MSSLLKPAASEAGERERMGYCRVMYRESMVKLKLMGDLTSGCVKIPVCKTIVINPKVGNLLNAALMSATLDLVMLSVKSSPVRQRVQCKETIRSS